MLTKETKAVIGFIALYILFTGVLFILFPYISPVIAGFQLAGSDVFTLFVLFVCQEIILLCLLCIAYRYVAGCSFQYLVGFLRVRSQWKGRGLFWKYVMGGLLCYFVGNGILLGLVTSMGIEIPGLYGEQLVVTVLSGLEMSGRVEYLLLFLMVAIVGPVVEEVLFRGAMTHSFMKEWGIKGVVLASLVFAAVHAERAVVRNLVILSLFLGYIYWKTESMRYSFLFHFFINGLAVLVLIISSVYPELVGGAM